MHIKALTPEIKSLDYLTVAYDVSKYKHNFYTHFSITGQEMESEGEIPSSMKGVIHHFKELKKLQKTHNFHGVRIVCEPTGAYEKALIRKAQEFGFVTQYVSGEASNKAKVIESNDSGKNDIKDARVIHMLASQNKTLSCKARSEIYAQLKFYNRRYEDYSLEAAKWKNKISTIFDSLFPDCELKAKQLYRKVTIAVSDLYQLNPYIINRSTYGEFKEVIEEYLKRKLNPSGEQVLSHIWTASFAAEDNKLPTWESNALAEDLALAYSSWKKAQGVKELYKKQMVELVEQTEEWQSIEGVPVSSFMFSRILAELGTWKDFPGINQLMRYAGLNLKERSSGTYQGQIRISKKGNSLMRKGLGQMVFSGLIKKGRLYHEIYTKKKEKRNGFYALTCVMRKTLKMLYGTYKSQQQFQPSRVFSQKQLNDKISA